MTLLDPFPLNDLDVQCLHRTPSQQQVRVWTYLIGTCKAMFMYNRLCAGGRVWQSPLLHGTSPASAHVCTINGVWLSAIAYTLLSAITYLCHLQHFRCLLPLHTQYPNVTNRPSGVRLHVVRSHDSAPGLLEPALCCTTPTLCCCTPQPMAHPLPLKQALSNISTPLQVRTDARTQDQDNAQDNR